MDKNAYGKLINGKLVIGIPSSYTQYDGRSVSNYDCQHVGVWISDGFKLIEKVLPKLGAGQEYGSCDIQEYDDKIVVTRGVISVIKEDNTAELYAQQIDELSITVVNSAVELDLANTKISLLVSQIKALNIKINSFKDRALSLEAQLVTAQSIIQTKLKEKQNSIDSLQQQINSLKSTLISHGVIPDVG